MMLLALVCASTLMPALAPADGAAGTEATRQAGVVESVVVHGNHTTPTDDVLRLAGEIVGQEASDATLAAIAGRLDASGRFDAVDVRRRFLSIDDPTRVLIVIVVDERPGVSDVNPVPGPMTRLAASGMWLPVLDYQEGYGLTYGARISFVDQLGPRSRISAPLTWGGERQAQVEVERGFQRRALARVAGGGGISRRKNPFFGLGDTRRSAWGRVESAPLPWLRASAGVRVADVSFGAIDDRLRSLDAELVVDTRRDPALPRNAAFVAVGVERLGFGAASLVVAPGHDERVSARRLRLDARGYLGIVRQTVLAVRALSVSASRPVPAFEQQLLGGIASLRGYDVGIDAGDNLAAVSAEILMPITSPLDIGRLGLKVFADGGTVYGAGQPLADQRLRWGYGIGAFVNATVLSFGVDVAWREAGGRPNAHVQLGVRLGR